MTNIDIFLLAIAMSIDAMVVSFSQGLIFKTNKCKNSLLLAFFFGFFQFFMPILGYFLTTGVYKYLQNIDNYIVMAIFLVLGVKFIIDAFEEKKERVCCIGFSCLFMLAVATSIDAFGAGISICFAKANIWNAAILIGIITFINSQLGFWSARLFKNFPSKYLEIAGGLILIELGISQLF